MNNSNMSYENLSLGYGSVRNLGTGEGRGKAAPPDPVIANLNDHSAIITKNFVDKLDMRRKHMDFWHNTTQISNYFVFV